MVVNLFAPWVMGERYPFTISPMFSDQPTQFCVYDLSTVDGQPVDARPFGLHLVYDGNPPGLGMGVVAAPMLHHYDTIADEATVRDHVQRLLRDDPDNQWPDTVIVMRRVGTMQDNRIVETIDRWEIRAGDGDARSETGL